MRCHRRTILDAWREVYFAHQKILSAKNSFKNFKVSKILYRDKEDHEIRYGGTRKCFKSWKKKMRGASFNRRAWMSEVSYPLIYENGCTIEDPNRNNYRLREDALQVPECTHTPYVDLMLCNGVDMFCCNSSSSGCCAHLDQFARIWSSSDRAQWQENRINLQVFDRRFGNRDVSILTLRMRDLTPTEPSMPNTYGIDGSVGVATTSVFYIITSAARFITYLAAPIDKFGTEMDKTWIYDWTNSSLLVTDDAGNSCLIRVMLDCPSLGRECVNFDYSGIVHTLSYFSNSLGIVLERHVNIYISEHFNHSIRMVVRAILTFLKVYIYLHIHIYAHIYTYISIYTYVHMCLRIYVKTII